MRTIVFHPDIYPGGTITTFQETKKAIENPCADFVRTTQMCFLNTQLFGFGFDYILIAEHDRTIYISIDDAGNIYCPHTQRQLKKSHNLYRLWYNGEFD